MPPPLTNLVAWWDFSDISTLFTDTARTTPVTVDTNPIRGVTDKSGNANHLSEPTNQPSYRTNVINGLSVALFTETTFTRLGFSTVVTMQPLTILIVVKSEFAAVTTENRGLVCGETFTPDVNFSQSTDTWGYYAGTQQNGSVPVD